MLLSGVKVLSLTHFMQGPSGVQFLADLGADVVKVEPTGRGTMERTWSGAQAYLDGESVYYLLLHRNQRAMTLDWKKPRGKEILTRLVRWADVLVENFRPGVLDRLGFSYDACASINPRLVYCSASGYGPDGPYWDLPGQDLIIQALSGLAAMTGQGDGPPTAVGLAAVDQHSAALLAMAAIAALFGRERTGRGTRVDVSLLDSALDMQIEPLGFYLNGGKFSPRSSHGLATTYHEAPYGIYATRDGWIAISINPLAKIASATESAELTQFRDDDAYTRREEIAEALGRVLKSRGTDEWLPRLRQGGVWCAPVKDYAEVLRDPQVAWNKSVIEFEYAPAERVRVIGHPVRYGGVRPPLTRRPPRLGEHNREVLRELGYTDEDIERFAGDDII